MNIAIAAPSPVPYVAGGAEGMFSSLHRHINAETPHHCELIKLPSPEHDFWSVVRSYEAFSSLDLSHFDVVITSKYPAWMVQHDSQVLYLFHRLRGLYDTYHLSRAPTRVESPPPAVEMLIAELRRLRPGPAAHAWLPEFFGRLDELPRHDPQLFRHPGPFLREIIHHLDRIGSSPERVRRYAAISETVRRRPNYFPSGVDVAVCHLPSSLEGFRCGSDEYLFTASRLDGPKRISLLIEAMRYVKADIPLLIAGTGPEEERLRKLAAGDRRVQFLGFVSDRRLVELYADALAVLYAPFQEDYGLITIEAMMSGKPVVTTTDAGGPNELVRDGETGWSVSPDPRAIARAIEDVCRQRTQARAMGEQGRRVAESITWDRVVDTLLERPIPRPAPRPTARKAVGRLVVATSFPVYPPRGGGQARVFHLYREMAREWEVHIVSLAESHQEAACREIAPGLWELRVPKSAKHEERERALSNRVGGLPVTDIALSMLHGLTPAYAHALAASAEGARAVVASHPFAVEAIRAAAPGAKLWYEAHNVETELKRDLLRDRSGARQLLEATEEAESTCWTSAELVYGCSAGDLETLGRLFGATDARVVEVPNGVEVGGATPFSRAEREALKTSLGLGSGPLVVFMGSWHQPNLDAVEHILRFAERLPGITFMVLGSAGAAFQYEPLPQNVVVTGVVDDDAKNLLVGCADLALNPMTSGSGTNLKMLDYFAAGTPVLSTVVGARGLRVRDGEHAFISELDGFVERIRAIVDSGPDVQARVTAAARKLAEAEYSWSVIAARFMDVLSRLEDPAVAGAGPPRSAQAAEGPGWRSS